MATGVAILETHLGAINSSIADIKGDRKAQFLALNSRLDARFLALNSRVDAQFLSLNSRVDSNFKWLLGAGGAALALSLGFSAAILLTMARHFGWV